MKIENRKFYVIIGFADSPQVYWGTEKPVDFGTVQKIISLLEGEDGEKQEIS